MRFFKKIGSLALVSLLLVGGRAFGYIESYMAIDRVVDEAKFWAPPLGNASFAGSELGTSERYTEHRAAIELLCARLGISSDRISYCIRDFYNCGAAPAEPEEISFCFSPDREKLLLLNSVLLYKLPERPLDSPFPFAIKIFPEGGNILAQPYDTDDRPAAESSASRVASFPGVFFRRCGKYSHSEPLTLKADEFFRSEGFIFFVFFPSSVCIGGVDRVALIRYRPWVPGNARELIFQAIDPELKVPESDGPEPKTGFSFYDPVTFAKEERTMIIVQELTTAAEHSYNLRAMGENENTGASGFCGGGNRIHSFPGSGWNNRGFDSTLNSDLQSLADFYQHPKNPAGHSEALLLFQICGENGSLFRTTFLSLLNDSERSREHPFIIINKSSDTHEPTPPPEERSAPAALPVSAVGSGNAPAAGVSDGDPPRLAARFGGVPITEVPDGDLRRLAAELGGKRAWEVGKGNVFVPLPWYSVTTVCNQLARMHNTIDRENWENTFRTLGKFYTHLQQCYGISGSYDRQRCLVEKNSNIIHVIRTRCDKALQLLDQLAETVAALNGNLQDYSHSLDPENPPHYQMNGEPIRH